MTDAARPFTVETLLAERPWVEALARRLVRDDATARDVVQQTWIAALENPPDDAGALRGWLSRVVRNAAFASQRAAGRRARHETLAVSAASAPSPDETVARAEAHRQVVDAVMSLDEPYRTSILLRFFEGLESDEVAARTGVPVETARTRVKRALALLRGRLDHEHGGDGRAWAVALVPLVTGKKGMPIGALIGGVIVGTKSAVAGALVGALLGALVTVGVMKRDEAPREVADVAPVAGPSGLREDRPDTHETARADNAAAKAPAAMPTKSALAAAFDEVEIDPPRFIAGSITGHVLTKDSAGVAGVSIKATARSQGRSSWRPSGSAGATTAENAVRDAVVWRKWSEATSREAVTDASGAFELTRLVEGEFSVSASTKGWSIRLANGSKGTTTAGSSVDFVATAAVDVPIQVVGADGAAPKEQVLIRWELPSRGGGSNAWWKPESPTVGVEPGTWAFTAELGKGARSKSVAVTVKLGTTPDTITLQLESLASIHGTVRFDSPECAWASAEVTAKLKGAADDRRALPRPQTVTAPTWKFAFDDVAPGEYELSVSTRQRDDVPAVTAVVQAASGVVTQDLVVPRISTSDWMVVRVTGPDGAPIPRGDANFCLRSTGPGGGAAFGANEIALADGGFLVPQKFRAGGKDIDMSDPMYARAQWQLEVTSKSCGKQALDFEHGATERLDVKFTAVATFVPVLEGVAGTPLEGRVQTMLGYPRGDFYGALNNAIGNAVEPGRYAVFVYLNSGGAFKGRMLARVPVELVAGENRVPIRVPELFALRVRIAGAAKGTEVRIEPARRPLDHLSGPTLAAADGGVVACGDLVAGIYRVTTTVGGETKEMLVRVPSEGEVTFAPTPIAGLVVTVDDAAGLLAKAGFQPGDVITAMDGVEIDSMQRLDSCYFGARGHDTAVLTVRRGGSTTTITIDPTKFSLRADYGGAWDPLLR